MRSEVRAAGEWLPALALALAVTPVAGAGAWPVPEGDAARSRLARGSADLKSPQVRWRRPVGDRVADGAALAADLDGAGGAELVIARGGRLDALTLAGAPIWSTRPLAVQELGGVYDFDGDGRREVLALGRRRARIIDALTGRVRWSTPPDRYADLGAVLVADMDGDRRPDLYVAETGCGANRPGPGHVYGFADGFDGERQRAVIDGPRRYYCGIWQTLADLDGDGQPELVVPDQEHLHAFDPRTGERTFAGEPLGDLPYGIAPHRVADVLPEPDGGRADELLVLFDFAFGGTVHRELVLLDLVEADGERRVAPVWRVPVADDADIDTGRAAVLPVAAGGGPTLLVSVFEDGAWSLRFVDAATGREDRRLPDTRLVAVLDGDGGPVLITREGDGRTPARFGRVVARSLDGAERWRVDRAAVLRRRPLRDEVRATPDAAPIRSVATAAGRRPVLLRDRDGDDVADAVQIPGPDGAPAASRDLAGPPADVAVTGDGPALVLALADGELAAFDAALALLEDPDGDDEPDVMAPAGLARVVAADVLGNGERQPIVLTATGRLVVLDADGQPMWSRRLNAGGEHPQAGQLVPGGPLEIVAPDGRTGGEAAWVALDGPTGEIRWRHALPLAEWRSLGPPLLVDLDGDGAEEFLRLDQRRADEVLMVTALDGADGARRWQTTVPPETHGWLGRLSAIRGADGVLRVFLPEAQRVHVLDPADGTVRRTIETRRQGGWIRATGTEPPLVRTGGNGPPEALRDDLTLAWSAPEGEGDLRSWLGRAAAPVAGAELWTTPGPGRPLRRYALETGELLEELALAGGERVDPAGAAIDLPQVTAVEDLFGAGEAGALVSAMDGHLYALRPDAQIGWRLPFHAAVGDPAVADVDGDDELEVLVSAGDGTIARLDEPGVDAPEAVWDNDGDQPAGGPEGDLDETRRYDRLGADWPRVADAEGYEARVVGPGGIEVAPWTDVLEPRVRFDDLDLTPGLRYAVEVRAWRMDGAERARSAVVRSDGVLVVDEVPPEAAVEVAPDPFRPVDGPLAIHVTARDDDALAALRLAVFDAAGVERAVVTAEPLAGPEADRVYDWEGIDLAGEALPTGRYAVRATVADRADNRAVARAEFLLCGPNADEPACAAPLDAGPDAAIADPDAGPPADGAPPPDGAPPADGAPADAGRDFGVGGGGCECGATGGPGPVTLLGLLAVAIARRRRRKVARPSA